MAQYADITKVVAPQSAVSGSRVDIEVQVKNLYSGLIGIMVGGALEYGITPWPRIEVPSNWANVPAGQTQSFSGYFTMPNRDVVIHAYSYYYDGGWNFDDEFTQKVTAWVLLATSSLVINKAVVGAWIPLGTASLSVKKALVGAWIPLATVSLSVKKGIVGGWLLLATTSLLIKVGIVSGKDIFRGDLVVEFSKHKA